MKLREYAAIIAATWHNVHYAAKPYLEAMGQLDTLDDTAYGMGNESGRDVVNLFLCNASTWRGQTARVVKKELREMLQGRDSPQQDAALLDSARQHSKDQQKALQARMEIDRLSEQAATSPEVVPAPESLRCALCGDLLTDKLPEGHLCERPDSQLLQDGCHVCLPCSKNRNLETRARMFAPAMEIMANALNSGERPYDGKALFMALQGQHRQLQAYVIYALSELIREIGKHVDADNTDQRNRWAYEWAEKVSRQVNW
jgi:hypothetical protein